MTRKTIVALITCSLFLCGCSPMLIKASKDPYKKLIQAQDLLKFNRPLPAERMSLEALEEFRNKNDEWGIAQASGVLGLIYQSSAIKKWENFYKKTGFLDKSVSYENRLDKSIEYLSSASKVFLEYERFDMLARTQLSIANA